MFGGTPRCRSDASAMRWKIGAATTPPVSEPTRGVSIITITVIAGLRDGTNPTNDTFCCELRVAAVDELVRRAGLAGDGVARQSAPSCRCRRSTTASRIGRSCATVSGLIARAHRPSARPACARRRGSTARTIARLDPVAAVGDRVHRRRHLQRRHADLVAHRDRGERAVVQLRGVPDDARALAGKVGRGRPAEAEAVDVQAQALGPEPQADLDRADVARLDDDVGEREHAVVVAFELVDDALARSG